MLIPFERFDLDRHADNIWSAAANRVFRFAGGGGGGAWYLPAAAVRRGVSLIIKQNAKKNILYFYVQKRTVTMFIFFQANS